MLKLPEVIQTDDEITAMVRYSG